MLVPVPTDPFGKGTYAASEGKPAVPVTAKGRSTGSKVAMGIGGAVVVGGIAVGAGVLGVYAAEHGIDATGEMVADVAGEAGAAVAEGAADAGDAIVDFGEEAGEFLADGADAAGDFIMDLF